MQMCSGNRHTKGRLVVMGRLTCDPRSVFPYLAVRAGGCLPPALPGIHPACPVPTTTLLLARVAVWTVEHGTACDILFVVVPWNAPVPGLPASPPRPPGRPASRAPALAPSRRADVRTHRDTRIWSDWRRRSEGAISI